MAKVITMGEIMLRLSTPNNEKFIQADEFDVNYGGGEANVAVSLLTTVMTLSSLLQFLTTRSVSAQSQL